MWLGWVLALHLKALCCFKVLFGSQYRALAPLGTVPQVNVTPNYWWIPLVVIKCRHRPNAPYFQTVFLTFSVRTKQNIWFWCWLQCQGSVKHLTSISYNAGKITVQCFLSVEEFKPQPLPLSDVFVLSEIWSFLWSGGNIVPSLLTATSLQRTQKGPKRGSPL